MKVAALYVDSERGPYAAAPSVDPWDLSRDATRYNGTLPVIAHPPCGHWGNYAHRCHDDGSTGPIAVEQVRKCGGVLEHPRGSKLWKHCGLPRPGEFADAWGGYTIEIRQCDWGHVAEKRTWLYIVGTTDLPPMPERAEPTGLTIRKPSGRLSSPLERMAKNRRHLTPPTLAEWLIELARRCAKDPNA